MRVHLSFDGLTTEELRELAKVGMTDHGRRPTVKCEGPHKWGATLDGPITLTEAMQLTRALWAVTLDEGTDDGS